MEEPMNQKTKLARILGSTVAIAALIGLFAGCATMAEKPKPAMVPTERGTVVYLEKYEFKRPPEGWGLMRSVEGGDFELGFVRIEKGDFPSQTTFMYDDMPYGGHQDLDKRAQYYCTRFLFNSGIGLRVTKQEKLQIDGRDAVAIHMEGENPNRNEKAKSKVYLVKKGNRIISFVCTQWRPLNGTFSQEPFDHFETFVQSFKFLKKDFYESFEDELKKAGL
jgi:hypothetical protein